MTRGRRIDYDGDGARLHGQLFAYAGPRRPGVLLFPAGRGIDDQALARGAALADAGFAVLVAAYHDVPQPIAEVDEAIAQAAMLRGDPSRMRARARSALAALAAQPEVDPRNIAAIGFCLGGSVALELARDGADIAAVAVFHGELATKLPAKPGAVQGRVLVLTGSLDPTVPPAQVAAFLAEMDAADADVEVRHYGGARHAFTNPAAGGHPAMAYHERSERRAWRALLTFLDDIFGVTHGDSNQAA
jgi:dienelactone hydrolase